MIKKFEISGEQVAKGWKSEKDRKEVEDALDTLAEFTRFPVYQDSAEIFSYCFVGHENTTGNLYIVDYGYALTAESIEKYLLENYEKPADEYLVCAELMPMDYEKYYKHGTFINLDGVDTGQDFYDIENSSELEKRAQFENNWIRFTVYDINKKLNGEPF